MCILAYWRPSSESWQYVLNIIPWGYFGFKYPHMAGGKTSRSPQSYVVFYDSVCLSSPYSVFQFLFLLSCWCLVVSLFSESFVPSLCGANCFSSRIDHFIDIFKSLSLFLTFLISFHFVVFIRLRLWLFLSSDWFASISVSFHVPAICLSFICALSLNTSWHQTRVKLSTKKHYNAKQTHTHTLIHTQDNSGTNFNHKRSENAISSNRTAPRSKTHKLI